MEKNERLRAVLAAVLFFVMLEVSVQTVFASGSKNSAFTPTIGVKNAWVEIQNDARTGSGRTSVEPKAVLHFQYDSCGKIPFVVYTEPHAGTGQLLIYIGTHGRLIDCGLAPQTVDYEVEISSAPDPAQEYAIFQPVGRARRTP